MNIATSGIIHLLYGRAFRFNNSAYTRTLHTIQHNHYTACPVQNTPIHHERTRVYIQPHPTYRSKNSLRNRSHPRKQHQVLQQTRKSLQPTSSTTTRTSPKSKAEKNFKELRRTSLDVYSAHDIKSVQ
jgi:hypothetical protein